MNLLFARLLSASVLFIVTLLVGTVPVYWYHKWIKKRSEQDQCERTHQGGHQHILSTNFYVQIVTQIGGGILFFTVLVHMIPEVRNNFEKYLKSNESIFANDYQKNSPKSIEDLDLPYLEIAICLGFFLIYFTEVLMHSILDRKHAKRTDSMSAESEKFDTNCVNNNIDSENHTNQSSRAESDETEPIIRRQTQDSQTEEQTLVVVVEHKSETDIPSTDSLSIRFLHGLVIISSFSIHSIFDGISIGVRTDISEMWTMFIAIASHKLMIALIISIELQEKCSNFLLVVFHMLFFSIMSPIGIVVVIAFEQSLDTHSEANPVVILLSALASGTILYIVFFEILQRDRVSKLTPLTQFIAMAIGFGVMFGITTTLREK